MIAKTLRISIKPSAIMEWPREGMFTPSVAGGGRKGR
jgi:hypothetical protein